MPTYPSPGRGAWRLTGGLLPPKPGSTSKMGYYRLAAAGETPIGSAWLRAGDTSHHAHVVYLGVLAIQELVEAQADGWFGPETRAKVIFAQQRAGIDTDGIVGRDTMKALLRGTITEHARLHGVPPQILGGVLTHESMLDPAAVGVNGADHGLAQINLGAHGDTVSLEQALDPDWALNWTAKDLKAVFDRWTGRTSADPWDIAVANHNSPLLAKRWATTGMAPYIANREFQIAEYVDKVKSAWADN